MIDPDLLQGTAERVWQPTPGLSKHGVRRNPDAGAWAPTGTVHLVDGQHRDAVCGVPCPYKWGEWPPDHNDWCADCVAKALRQGERARSDG